MREAGAVLQKHLCRSQQPDAANLKAGNPLSRPLTLAGARVGEVGSAGGFVLGEGGAAKAGGKVRDGGRIKQGLLEGSDVGGQPFENDAGNGLGL